MSYKMTIYKKGMRVRLNAEGRRTIGRQNPDRLGTIASNPRRPELVTIRWDGHSIQTTSSYSVTLIESVQQSHTTEP